MTCLSTVLPVTTRSSAIARLLAPLGRQSEHLAFAIAEMIERIVGVTTTEHLRDDFRVEG
ncbi:MAG: hypothetical protein WAP35_03230 [Solirubrobacterales bacterium]